MDIDERLANWSRYYRPHFIRSVCGSIEGKLYRAPWRQWIELRDIQHPPPIDWRDAELIEQAWRGMLGRHKTLLKLTYMTLMPPQVIARKIGLKTWDMEGLNRELHRAKRHIVNVLANIQEYDTLPRNSTVPNGLRPCETIAGFVRPKETAEDFY